MTKAVYYEGNQRLRSGDAPAMEPLPGEVRIAVSYAGICGTDLHIYHGHMDHRVSFPHIMGHELSGVVDMVGPNCGSIKEGDRVTVMPLQPCDNCPACDAGHSHICHKLKFMGIETPGAFQKYWTVPVETIVPLPDNLSLKHGALIEPLAVACHDVRRGKVAKGDYVVILGGGPIGTLIALVAKASGAEVLVSEINPHRLELLENMGLNVINPLERDVVAYVEEATGGAGCDVVFEVTSSTAGAELMTRLPRTRGRIVVVGIFNKPVPVDLHKFFWRELEMSGARVYEREDFSAAVELAASGKLPLDTIISTVYPLDQLAEGFRQMESGSSVMKILIECQ